MQMFNISVMVYFFFIQLVELLLQSGTKYIHL